MTIEYKFVVLNNNNDDNSDLNLTIGAVYYGTDYVGTFTLELIKFPYINVGLPGYSDECIIKYSYQINFDETNINKKIFSGYNVIGTFSGKSRTKFNKSPLGLPYGKYENIARNMDNSSEHGEITIQMNIEKNDATEYNCIVRIG